MEYWPEYHVFVSSAWFEWLPGSRKTVIQIENSSSDCMTPEGLHSVCVSSLKSPLSKVCVFPHPSPDLQIPAVHVVSSRSFTRLRLPGTNFLFLSVILPLPVLSNLLWKVFSFQKTFLQSHCPEVCVCVCAHVCVCACVYVCVESLLSKYIQ